MGALTFDALLRSLKQGVPDPVYYLHGDEDVLKDEAVRALVDRAVDPAARDFNLDQRSAPELDAEAFHALVNTPPMLAATRAVVVRGLEQLKKTAKLRQELLRYLESPNPTTLLVLVQAAGEAPDAELVRRTTAVAVEPLPPARVERWMAHRAGRSEEHTSELQSQSNLVCRLLLEKKKKSTTYSSQLPAPPSGRRIFPRSPSGFCCSEYCV